MKQKLKSNLRVKRRYILFDGNRDEIEKIILDYLGILGWGKAMPVFLKDNGKNVLAVERNSLNDVRAAVEISGNKVKILKTSGTLKSLKNY